MNKLSKKTKIAIAVACVIAVICIAGALAYFTDIEEVTNHAKMGIVDIDLKEYMIDGEGHKVAWKDRENVLPGEIISKIPEIKCVSGAVDCYVRAKVEISCKDTELQNSSEMLTLENLNINEEDWYYCEEDGYFYYKNILKDSDEPIILFTEVLIPPVLDNTWSLEQLSIDITAEAIQSKNFTPKFDEGTTEPWPGIKPEDIQECIYPNHVKYPEEGSEVE